MKALTTDEILFLKTTGLTATVVQCDEWDRTIWGHEPNFTEVATQCMHIGIASVDDVLSASVFITNLYNKILNSDDDAIALEDLAVYLFRTFCTVEELERLLQAPHAEESSDGSWYVTASAAWLKRWKYHFGFRKVDDADYLVGQALNPNYKLELDEQSDVMYVYKGDDDGF